MRIVNKTEIQIISVLRCSRWAPIIGLAPIGVYSPGPVLDDGHGCGRLPNANVRQEHKQKSWRGLRIEKTDPMEGATGLHSLVSIGTLICSVSGNLLQEKRCEPELPGRK